MKTKMMIMLTLFVVFFSWQSAPAEELNFPAGSLIIPMDSFYQSGVDGGVLEAYGLVYYLLDHKDQTCMTACDTNPDPEACKAGCDHDITVYWIINQEKVTIDGTDFVIEDLTLDAAAGETVAKNYDHAGGVTDLIYKTGDSFQRITYLGAPWIIHADDAAIARTIIDQAGWSSVEVHVAQVPFAAPVYREMKGTPPRIALMNNSEKSEGGNAAILESYLRLAGICTYVYDVVTPFQIRDGILLSKDYDFLWAPHWHGSGSDADTQTIVDQVGAYLRGGNGLLAECGCIEEFEQLGHFLTTNGTGMDYNGGSNKAEDIIYNDLVMPNSQIGDFFYEPEGGSIHNWRPFGGPDHYNDTVTRFTIDNVDVTGWDYYVGGYAFGDRNNGYAVYLGGHSYASCGSGSGDVEVDPELHVHEIEFEFTKDISDEAFELHLEYTNGVFPLSLTVPFSQADLGSLVVGSIHNYIQVDLTHAAIDGKKLEHVEFRNLVPDPVTIESITFSWTGGDADQMLKMVTDLKTDIKHYDKPEVVSGVELDLTAAATEEPDFILDAYIPAAEPVGCTVNDDCKWDNIGAVRYVLNTLFNIKYQLSSHEYVRAAPILMHPYLYQGSFEYPNYEGHFRRYDVTVDPGSKVADWDTATDGRIESPPKTNNSDHGARKVYTAKNNGDGTWSKIDFDVDNIAELRAALDLTPDNGDDNDEKDVIKRLRGHYWDNGLSQWVESTNKLGAIMHSAPVIVGKKTRVATTREEMAYVGDLYGMLHAIKTDDGKEKWAYIPSNLLGKLKNDRTDPNAIQDFAGVDASPTAKDVYYDHDGDGNSEWRTILAGSQGFGGTSIYALDVSNPHDCDHPDHDHWFPLWEATDTEAPGGGMGHAYSVAIDKVKWPIKEVYDEVITNGIPYEIYDYEMKWVVFVSTGFAQIAVDHGGINVFAFDLKTGTKLWHFSSEYADSVNDIPGAATVYDLDGDTFVDRVYVGDMNGRMWELDAVDGSNPNGTEGTGDDEKQIPLFNAGIGNPISVSPAIVQSGGDTILIFGTGGADWAADDQAYAVYAINATQKHSVPTYADGAGTLLWKVDLAVGEKVWSTPTVAYGYIFVATAFGSMEGSDPRLDVPGVGQDSGNFLKLKLADGGLAWKLTDIGKVRGSIFVDRQHAYMTTIDGQIIQIGGGDFANGTGTRVTLRSWRQM